MLRGYRYKLLVTFLMTYLTKLLPCSASNGHPSTSYDQEHKEALRAVVKDLIGFKNFPSSDFTSSTGRHNPATVLSGRQSSRQSASRGGSQHVPRYMQRLYEQYQAGLTYHDADTVRNIHAQPAIINGSNMIVFNLSSISDVESIVASEIYVYRRHAGPPANDLPQFRHKRQTMTAVKRSAATRSTNANGNDDLTVNMIVSSLAPSAIDQVASFELTHSQRSGWQSFNATAIIRRMINARINSMGTGERLMAVSFMQQDKSPDGLVETMATLQPLSKHYQQFPRVALLIFTQQQQHDSASNSDYHRHHRAHEVSQEPDVIEYNNDEGTQVKHLSRPAVDSETGHQSRDRTRLGDRRMIADREILEVRDNRSADDVPSTNHRRQNAHVAKGSKNANISALPYHKDAIAEPARRTFSSNSGRSVNSRTVSFETIVSRLSGRSRQQLPPVSLNGDDAFEYADITMVRPRTKRNVDENEVPQVDETSDIPDSDPSESFGFIPKYNLPHRATVGRVKLLSINRNHHNQLHHHHDQGSNSSPTTQQPTKSAMSSQPPRSTDTIDLTTRHPLTNRTGNGRRRSRPRSSRKRPADVGAVSDDAVDYQSQLLPDPSEYVDRSSFWIDDIDDGQCKRRRLMVDFADIGWSDWILAPSSFEAFYCDGECRFPLSKKLRPSNHAHIQSIVQAIGIQSFVPSPCCVPSSLSPLTLLYFDESQNVVLRKYPDMSVNSCGCR